MIQKKLIEKFGNHINHMSCIYLHDGEASLRYFLEKLKPMDTIIEIGTYQGVSACILSEYAKVVHTFDIEQQDLTSDIINYMGLQKRIQKWIGNQEKIKDYVKKILEKADVDLAFIDGWHKDGQIEIDFEMVKSCKNILIHDYAPDFKEVYDFCNKLKGYKREVKGTFILLTAEEKTQKKAVRRGRKKKQ